MAVGRYWNGDLDTDYWIKQVKNAKNKTQAIEAVKGAMQATSLWGVSDGDQREVVKVINAYADKYDLKDSEGFNRIYKIWNPDSASGKKSSGLAAKDSNSINLLELDQAIKRWEEIANDPDIYYTGASVSTKDFQDAVAANVTNKVLQQVKNANPATNKLAKQVAQDAANKAAKINPVVSVNSNGTVNKLNNTTSGGGNGANGSGGGGGFRDSIDSGSYGGSGGSGGSVGTGSYAPITNPNALTKEDIEDILNDYWNRPENQKPEPKSAAEIAALHDIDYNLENILADYNNATNQYYDEAIKEQNKLRNTFNRDNAFYVNSLLNDYYNTYQTQANTAANKANLAATMFATNLAANDTNSSSDMGMVQSINQLDKARQAELLQNKVEAENYYNNLGKTLAGFSTDYYNSDINSYIGAIEKYGQMYSANRLLARAQAEAAAEKYSGLAKASVSNAGAAATNYLNNDYQRLVDYYFATGDTNARKTVQQIINAQNKTSGGGS